MGTAVATSVVDHVITADKAPLVKTKHGCVQGFTIDLENRSKADVFLGVPFAKPPTEELKFERPQSPTPWDGVYQADKFKDECEPLFVHPEVVSASDDSLYLNIFAPSDKSTIHPVMVIIHGGGFAFGSAMHYRDSADLGNSFVSKGIVVVAIQYRLGVYGFASTGDETLPGNLGLWDQVAALKFVQENIRGFGGDPGRVTLYGYSAGAASVCALALSPHSRDLFHQAIQMSGSAFSQWATNDLTLEATKELAKTLGCESDDSTDIKRCLKEATRDDVRAAVLKMGPTALHLMLDKWAPRIDGDLFPSSYEELSKNAPKKPTYMGVVEEECYVWTILTVAHGAMHMLGIPPQDQPTYGEEQFRQFVENVVATEKDFGSQVEEVRQKVLGFYLKIQNGEKKDNVFYLKKYTQLCSDLMWNIPAMREAHVKVEHAWPVFLYKHTYLHKHQFLFQTPYDVAYHSHDHRFIFRGDNHMVRAVGWDLTSEDDHDVANYLVNSLVNFVKTGSPSTENRKWLPATAQKPSQYMEIDVPRVMRDALFDDRLKFWDSMTKTYGFDFVSGKRVDRQPATNGRAQL
ncbi:CRE-GES-1 protein [Aphelenchoides avenae]|nr:CRE-GES-1 protein [Aphelenchus avenae]